MPVQHALARRMMVLSDEEVAVVRYAAAIGDAMAEAMREAAAPEIPESEVYSAGLRAAYQHGCAAPGMLLSSGPTGIGWGPPAWVYRPQKPRVLASGDMILAEVFTSYGMKETQHQVAIAIGDVHEDFERAARAARASYEAGLATLRPGVSFGALADAMKAPIAKAGGGFVHPVVHGLNPFGSVSGVHLAMADLPEVDHYDVEADIPTVLGDLPLEPGMCFAFEPNCVLGRRVVNLGGTVLVGEDGAIELNPLTSDLLRVAA